MLNANMTNGPQRKRRTEDLTKNLTSCVWLKYLIIAYYFLNYSECQLVSAFAAHATFIHFVVCLTTGP